MAAHRLQGQGLVEEPGPEDHHLFSVASSLFYPLSVLLPCLGPPNTYTPASVKQGQHLGMSGEKL